MSDETRTLTAYWVILAVVFFGMLAILRVQHAKIIRLEKTLISAREFCLGKENKIKWCAP